MIAYVCTGNRIGKGLGSALIYYAWSYAQSLQYYRAICAVIPNLRANSPTLDR